MCKLSKNLNSIRQKIFVLILFSCFSWTAFSLSPDLGIGIGVDVPVSSFYRWGRLSYDLANTDLSSLTATELAIQQNELSRQTAITLGELRYPIFLQTGVRFLSNLMAVGVETGLNLGFFNPPGQNLVVTFEIPVRFYFDLIRILQVYTGVSFQLQSGKDVILALTNQGYNMTYDIGGRIKGGRDFPLYLDIGGKIDVVDVQFSNFVVGVGALFTIF